MNTTPHLRSIEDAARFTGDASELTDNGAPTGGTDDRNRGPAKARPDLALPSDRLRFENQEKVLLDVATLSGNSRRGCTAEEMSASIGLKGTTGGLNSRFFRAAGWFEGVARGTYTASAGLLEYARYINIAPDEKYQATALMRDEVRNSWFWQVLEPMMASGRPLQVRTAMLALSKEANATDHTVQLETVIDWLVWVGIIAREGDTIVLRGTTTAPEVSSVADVEVDEVVDPVDERDQDLDETPEEGSTVRRRQAAPPSDDALVSFNLSVRLTADDVKELSDEKMQFLMDFASKLRG